MPMPPPNVTGRWDGFAFEMFPKRTLVGPYRHLNTCWDVFCYLGSCFLFWSRGRGFGIYYKSFKPLIEIVVVVVVVVVVAVVVSYWF